MKKVDVDAYDDTDQDSRGDINHEKQTTGESQDSSPNKYFYRIESNPDDDDDFMDSDKPRPALFADVAGMKEKVRAGLVKEQYSVHNFYKTTGIAQKVARHSLFDNFTLGVIAFNAVWIAIDTDYNGAETLLAAQAHFQVMEHFFCFYFTWEWTMRYLAFKRKLDGLKDAWFVFDSMMVAMMVLETWVMTAVMLLLGGGGGGGLGNASILRLVRLMRLSRMARMARLLRAMPELMILVKGMAAAMRSVMFTLVLLVGLLYVFGIAFKQLADGTEAGTLYYPTVPDAMYTLLLDGTFLDSLGKTLQVSGESSAVLPVIFLLFVLLAALTVMNMLIGVLCEVVSAVAATEQEEMTVSFVKHKMQYIMKESGLDQDGNGEISQEEFMQIVENKQAMRTLAEVGVDPIGLIELGDMIFDEPDKELSFEEFMGVVLQLRGSNTATVRDIMDMRKAVRFQVDSLASSISEINRKLDASRRDSVGRPSSKSASALGRRGSAPAMAAINTSKEMILSPMSPTSPSPQQPFSPAPPGMSAAPLRHFEPASPPAVPNPNGFSKANDHLSPPDAEVQAWLGSCESSLRARLSEAQQMSTRTQASYGLHGPGHFSLPGVANGGASPKINGHANKSDEFVAFEAALSASLEALYKLQEKHKVEAAQLV
mmetsp:Transcript_76919/g.135525  ORF Transcript_76919/g.135525 Transcript_76919/m.135525 type:complete len:655 (-) Transcript_76919:121-2085(-)